MTELRVQPMAAKQSGPAMTAQLVEWVNAESPSSDPIALARLAETLTEELESALGHRVESYVVGELRHLLLSIGERSLVGQRVLLLCHYDTVWPPGSWGEQPATIASGILHGPGAFDMKAGLVQCVQALRLLTEAGQSLDGVCLLVTADEEIGSPSSRELIEGLAADCDAVLVFEASADGGALKTARKGTSIYQITIEGRAAHAGLEPEKGVNATIEAAHQVLQLNKLNDPNQGTTVTPTLLISGETGNTVPARAELSIDVRALSMHELRRVDQAIYALTPVLTGVELTVSGGINRPPLDALNSAALYRLCCEVAVELGFEAPGSQSVGGASDGNFTAGLGIPTLDGLGAVGAGAHARNEHVELAAMPERVTLAAGLIQRLLEGALRQGNSR